MVSLTDYKNTHPATTLYEPFTVEVKNCMITGMVFDAILDKTYNIYTDEVEFEIPEFTQVVQQGYTRDGAAVCDYDVEYSIALDDGSDLPAFMHWNFIDRKLSYRSDSKTDEQVYNVVMTATVSANAQSGGLTVTQPIKVTVQDGCSTDSIFFTSHVPDYNYYLGVDTSEDASPPWAFTTGRATAEWDISVRHTAIGCPVAFRLERDVSGVKRPLTPDEASVFADLVVTEDNLSYSINLQAMTDREDLEGSEWTIALVAERGRGGGVNEPVYATFRFAVKNVCRDLPWETQKSVANELTFNVYDNQQVAFESGLVLDDAFPADWAQEYCQITYKVLYNSGSLKDTLFARDSTINMYEFDASTNGITGLIKSREWIGTHTVVVQAQVGPDGIYGTYDSTPIQLTMEEPCLSTQLLAPTNIHSTLKPE
jgi:hypothetical protein